MALAAMSIATTCAQTPVMGKDVAGDSGLRRSDSGNELRCDNGGMRRSASEPLLLRCSLDLSRKAKPAAAAGTKLKNSRSIGIFPFSSPILPIPMKHPHPFDTDTGKGMRLLDPDEDENSDGVAEEEEIEPPEDREQSNRQKVHWMRRILELRRQWKDRQRKEEEVEEADEVDHCDVSYDEEDGNAATKEVEFNDKSFGNLLTPAPLATAKLFSKLAFLCNMAYEIPELKAEDLQKYYGLDLVTTSLEKKTGVASGATASVALKVKLDGDSTRPPPIYPYYDDELPQRRRPMKPSVAYRIAASAASYVHSRARGLLSLGGGRQEEDGLMVEGEVAACIAASTMTTVVAGEETAKQETARDLRSPHSSPCEWFVCDDDSSCTRCFVIQGSDSLASWHANLMFEPTKFEGTDALVHRGIYEAAKGIYEQFMPEITDHLERFGHRAKLQFTGHSLGGSLALLVNLMLLGRGDVQRDMLLPVVTFGSPFVFCGGRRVLEELGFDERHVRSVMMHRDIVPRAFSCSYPNYVSQLLKRLNGTFRSHPCLNQEKLLYSPLGQLFILQPEEKYSPSHPFLLPGSGLYLMDIAKCASKAELGAAVKAFLNSPHPLETLSDPTAYGSEGTILRDHDSGNYLRAVNGVLRWHIKSLMRKTRQQRQQHWWSLLTTTAPDQACCHHHARGLGKPGVVANEVVTGV